MSSKVISWEEMEMSGEYDDYSSMAREFVRLHLINELEKHIEHPTKPGYKRQDILERIEFLKKNDIGSLPRLL